MTKLLDQAVDVARRLPPAAQDKIARIVLQLVEVDEPLLDVVDVALDSEEEAAIAISKAAAGRGDYASDAEVLAVWAKHSL